MNRLILIGNGFDLAHGLNTSYNDFILWYLKDVFNKSLIDRVYEDDLLKIVNRFAGQVFLKGSIKTISDFIDHYYLIGFHDLLYNRSLETSYSSFPNHFEVTIKSTFLRQLLLKCKDSNWVDIENNYYSELTEILVETRSPNKENKLKSINTSLKKIIELLSNYLFTLTKPVINNKYLDIFDSLILKEDVVTVNLQEDSNPEEIKVLNFNYTSTIENYFESSMPLYSTLNFEVNYIHGKIGDVKNPLIFGFGDELDNDYSKMEAEKTKGFLEYIKSFWYFKTSNYHDLIRFIDSNKFQVFILGHSCGLSDRTMLNMIFEHDNCMSIKIYYHQHENGNNFTNLTQEISRHFTNKGVMRKKIVPFDRSMPMPQIKQI